MFLGRPWSQPPPAAAAVSRAGTRGRAAPLPRTPGPVASATFSADPGSGILTASAVLPTGAPGTWPIREWV